LSFSVFFRIQLIFIQRSVVWQPDFVASIVKLTKQRVQQLEIYCTSSNS